jgi:capsid portal protein
MILSVAGGRLTSQSFRELEKAVTKQSIGKDRQHKILLIEAVPEREGLDEKGATVQLKVDKLTDVRQSDGLFSEYDRANQDKIRSSGYRLPL